ncbi:MAG TPA: hypothetical protein VMT99_02045 [Candidatus Paceibacterota bacterium]|nr:hypothetical protein [Candidatus Paceibacterota bacterium]
MLVGSLMNRLGFVSPLSEESDRAIHGGDENSHKERKMRQENQEYIVNLAQQLVGKNVLEGLKSDQRLTPHILYRTLQPVLKSKLDRMNAETLGRICSCGHTKDFSEPLEDWCGFFIQKTGIEEVVPPEESVRNYGQRPRNGLQTIRDLAIATLVSVAYDIIRQAAYEEDGRERKERERKYQQGLADYIHRGPSILDSRKLHGI